MPVLEEGKLLFKERLANEKSIDSTDDGKSEGFVKFCAMTKETEMPNVRYGQVLSV